MLKKTLLLFGIVLLLTFLIGPYVIGQSMLKTLPQRVKQLEQYGLKINFKEIKAPFCFLCVQFQGKEGQLNVLNQTFYLGDVVVEIPIYNYHSIYFKTNPLQKENYLTLNARFNNNVINVYDSHFMFNQLEASLTGFIDLNSKNILLKGDAFHLKSFIAQFVPNALSKFLFLLFKDKQMPVELDIKDNFLRINKLPIFPLKN
ncbi:MAG: hypothetical protein IJY92_01570 [Alphaproteobacteria bacterium]|nr:hypothetical protein [Alphaproteobacteria bacterium]